MADLGPSLITGAAVIAGGALAVGGGVVTQLLQGRASAQARLDASRDQRNEFQRQTILELQDAIYRMARAAGKAHHADTMAHKSGAAWGTTLLGQEIDQELLNAMVRLKLIAQRIKDDALRKLAIEFATQAIQVSGEPTKAAAEARLKAATEIQQKALDRSGEALRPLL